MTTSDSPSLVLEAALAALPQLDTAEGIERLQALLARLEDLRHHPDSPRAAAVVHAGLADGLRRRGQVQRALHHGLEADLLARRSGDPDAFARATLAIGQIFFQVGHYEEARLRLRQVVEAAGTQAEHQHMARMNIAATLRAEGRLNEAAEAFDAALAAGPSSPGALASLLLNAASCFHQIGRVEDGLRCVAQARRSLQDLDRPHLDAWADAIEAWVAARAGAFERARRLAHLALPPDRPGSTLDLRSSAARALAEIAHSTEDPIHQTEALEAVAGVLEQAEREPHSREGIDLHLTLASIYEARDELARAVRHLRRSSELAAHLSQQDERLRIEREELRLELVRVQVESDALLAHTEELRRAQRAVIAANAASARQLATLAHDLRSPLTSMLALVDLIDTTDPAAVRKGLDRMAASIDRMVEMLDGALLPQRTGEHDPIGIFEVVRDAVAGFEALALKKGQRIEITTTGPAEVRADSTPLVRLIDNLLSNALKYGKPGGTVKIAISASLGTVDLLFLDDGPGFPGLDPSEGLLFGHRLSSRPSGDEGSDGVGLHTVYQLLAELGGVLAIGTRPEGGAMVRVTLPLA